MQHAKPSGSVYSQTHDAPIWAFVWYFFGTRKKMPQGILTHITQKKSQVSKVNNFLLTSAAPGILISDSPIFIFNQTEHVTHIYSK